MFIAISSSLEVVGTWKADLSVFPRGSDKVGVVRCLFFLEGGGGNRSVIHFRIDFEFYLKALVILAFKMCIQVNAAGDLCAICQEKMHAPILLRCKHIFCEDCVSEW